MQFRQSLDNLTGSAFQQLTGVLVFLVVPAVLGVEEFGQVVFILTLWSFLAFSDLGFAYIYNRRMPGFHADADAGRIAFWDATILRWRLAGAAVLGAGAALVYGAKYGHAPSSLLVAVVPVVSTLTVFCVAQATAKAAFREVRDLKLAQATVRLLIIPCVLLWSLPGWFIGQLVAAVPLLTGKTVYRTLRGTFSAGARFDWSLIRENLGAALLLGTVAGLWGQILSIARLLASFQYPDATIAVYGLVNAGFQIVMMTLVSIYAPISIRANALFAKDPAQALRYVSDRNRIVLPAFMAIALAAILAGPPVLRALFPAYALDDAIVLPLLLSLLHVPAIVMFGALLVGAGKYKGYLAALAAGLVLCVLIATLCEPRLGTAAAAVSQFVGLGALVVMLYFAAMSGPTIPGQSRWRLALPALFSVAVLVVWAVVEPR